MTILIHFTLTFKQHERDTCGHRAVAPFYGRPVRNWEIGMMTPTVVFWDQKPVRQEGQILSVMHGDLPARLLERLSMLCQRTDYCDAAIEMGGTDWETDTIGTATDSIDTFHIAFSRGSVQVSYGRRGFVPLARLLDYNPNELCSYMETPVRIVLGADAVVTHATPTTRH